MIEHSTINALMEQASSGDDAAFGALAAAVQDELFRLAGALGLRRDDAAEATQEALVRAYANRSRWTAGTDAMPWLCGIAVNVAREARRREKRKKLFLRAAWHDASAREAESPIGSDGDGLPQDESRLLRQAVAGLPDRQREAIACRYLRRMSVHETALAMGCAEGTVKSAVSTALERLRAVLEDQDEPT
ncbi:MAG TPA: RNA polymerase sigma factor [Tepidisphaeraceae bacterium]|jgi:RNA polymerase sigma-70 factor (ECF subfamily)|nr:RNA polymerase sigma factor [Tepidisphaeraceae bacterium]